MSGHELAMALRCAYLSMHRQVDAHFAPLEVTADQFVVLAALARGDASTQRELVARTSSDPNTLRAMLVRLEQKGLIARQPHPTDRRARGVKLTAAGRSAVEVLWSGSEALREQFVAPYSPRELSHLIEYLRRLSNSLSEDDTESPATARITAEGTHP